MISPRRVFASGTAVFLATCALVLVPTGTASAHPLGNFTVNRYDGLVATPGQLKILHVEDRLAEAILDEGGSLEGFDSDLVELAMDEESAEESRPPEGAWRHA